VIILEKKAEEIGLDVATTEKLIQKFIEVTREDIRRMKIAAEVDDWSRLREIAHHIKGAAVNLNLTEITEAGEQLENLYEHSLQKGANELIENLERRFLQLMCSMEN
jgi:HPt (histidine-containing phosphotransfer) domain-containing protein